MTNTKLFAIALTILVLGFAGAVAWNTSRVEQQAANLPRADRTLLERMHSPSLGPREAKVVVTEFIDPACETCAAFYPLVKKLMAKHPDQIRLIVRFLPLHSGSDQVVVMLEAARRQSKLWPALELVLANQKEWAINHHADPAKVLPMLGSLGLDQAKLKEDMNSNSVADVIMQDMDDARRLGVDKTPGYFVNGRPLEPFGYEPLEALIESELKANYK